MAEVYVEGLDSLLRKLDEIARVEAVQRGLETAAIRVETAAKEKCPHDDGTLRANITHRLKLNIAEIFTDSEKLKESSGTNTEYAPYVELGTGLFAVNGDGKKDVPWVYQDAKGDWHTTSGQHPQPFLYPALTENTNKIADDVKAGILQYIKGLVK